MISILLTLALSSPTHDPLREWISVTSTSDQLLKSAWEAHNQQEWDNVLEKLTSRQNFDPLQWWLVASALQTQDPKAAYDILASRTFMNDRCTPPEEDVPLQRWLGLRAALISAVRPTVAAELMVQLGTPAALLRAIHLTGQQAPRRWYQNLLFNFPDSSESIEILGQIGPEKALATYDTIREKLNLLEVFLEAHRNQDVLTLSDILEPLIASPSHHCRLGYFRGKALRKLRKYDEALEILQQTRKTCIEAYEAGAWDLEHFTMQVALLEAKLLAIKSKGDALIEVAQWMNTFVEGHSYIDDVLLWSAQNLETKRAISGFKQVVEMAGDQAPLAAWQLAMEAINAGDDKQARHWLTTLLAMPNASVDDRERATFFLGRIELAEAPPANAISSPPPPPSETSTTTATTTTTNTALTRWEHLVQRPSFYGFLALSRLRKLAPDRAQQLEKALSTVATSSISFEPSEAIMTHPSTLRARRWFFAGATDWAISELKEVSCGVNLQDPKNVLTLAALFHAMGAYPESQILIRRPGDSWLQGPLSPDNLLAWRIAYSRPFVDEFQNAANSETLNAFLLTALAREESTFDADIVSWAGAVGLAQLMPSTASEAYQSVYGGQLDLSQLTSPSVNLRLGARVLKRNLLAFNNINAFALSAYNGGAARTRRTLPKLKMPYEDWIESTRVAETQAYIKRVSATWVIYHLLHSHHQNLPSFPDTVGPGATAKY